MKKINLLLAICGLMFVFSACDYTPTVKKVYFIKNASESVIYLSKTRDLNSLSSPFIELKQYDYEEVYSYYVLDEDKYSELDINELIFILKYKDKYYTITKENIDGPSLSANYFKDVYLDYKEYPSKSQYNCEAYVFTITDEFMASLTPDE